MQKMLTALLAMVLAVPMLMFAQSDQQTQNEQQNNNKQMQQQQNQAAGIDQNGTSTLPKHTMTGMVGNNGKSFTSGSTTYKVNNPKALKNYDNQNVSVRFQFNTDNNTIHVISASPAQSQSQ